MDNGEQMGDTQSVGWSGLERRSSSEPAAVCSRMHLIAQLHAVWGKLGVVASNPDFAVNIALERIRRTNNRAEIIAIGFKVLASYNMGATMEFAELAHLTAMAAEGERADGFPTALRQVARKALETYARQPDLEEERRERVTQLLRQIEREQVYAQ